MHVMWDTKLLYLSKSQNCACCLSFGLTKEILGLENKNWTPLLTGNNVNHINDLEMGYIKLSSMQ